MRLAFDNKAHYTDFSEGYKLYRKRAKIDVPVDERIYRGVVKAYCKSLAERITEYGMIDLPCGLGTISVAAITRKPQYRGKKFLGYGKKDWNTGLYDGELKAFGLVYLPNRNTSQNLRCYGFVANRQLFKKMKKIEDGTGKKWVTLKFNDDMI